MPAAPPTTIASRGAAPARYAGGFARVLTANAVSNLGDGMLLAAAPLLAASLTDDPRLIANVSAAATLPWLLVALVSGAFVDRVDRRRLRGAVDLVRALTLGGFAALVAFDAAELWMLYVAVLLVGVGETLADTAAQAMLPAVVGPSHLRTANSQMEATTLVADRLAGPPLGSVAFAAVAAAPFAVDAASFAVSAGLVLSLRGSYRAPVPEVAAPTGLRGEIAEGVRTLFGVRLLAAMTVVVAAWNLLDAMMMAILVRLASDRLDVTGAGYGLLLTATALGGLLASLSAPAVIRRAGDGGALLLALALSVPAAAVLGTTTNPFAAGAALALLGWLGVTWNVSAVSLRQELIPDRVLGRATSVYRLFSLGAIPVGAVVGGVAAAADIRAPYLVAAAGSLVITALAAPFLSNRAVARARSEAA